ncbi:MAG: hypothetical protein Q8P24_02970 [Desulfobacterales bacterium]|nr:hypothetical protein [Desulfobacterales bacterium]
MPDDSLLVAETEEDLRDGRRFKKVIFRCLSDTWRTKAPEKRAIVSKGKLMAYLNPASPTQSGSLRPVKRVVDRDDLQMLLPFNMRKYVMLSKRPLFMAFNRLRRSVSFLCG